MCNVEGKNGATLKHSEIKLTFNKKNQRKQCHTIHSQQIQ